MMDVPETIKLYDDAPYDREFTARITGMESCDGGCLLTLDRTLFFPEEGGQTSDRGNLGGFEVMHAAIEGGVITHTVKCDLTDLAVGDEIKGMIDWGHRFSNMQNHTGEHILSGLLHKRWQSENVGFHLSDNTVTLDTSKELTDEDIRELERAANEVIYRNTAVTCRYYKPEELEQIAYRSKTEIAGDVRLVTIGDVDVCACCAPHVAHTGEIGIIKIIKAIRYKGGMRFEFLAGERAYQYLCGLQDMTLTLSHMLSESPEKLDSAVERLLKQNEGYKVRIKNDAAKRLEEEISGISPDKEDVILFTDPIDNIVQRNAVNRLSAEHKGISAVFASDDDGGYNFILSCKNGDSRVIAKLLRESLDAKGGGSPEMIQGNVRASKEAVLEALSASQPGE